MENLCDLKCEACRKGAPKATAEEISRFRPQIPEWEILTNEGIELLNRTFKFPNFVEALAFTNRVGELAESEGHHPAILTEWGKVTVQWYTRKIKGLHQNDLIMAAKTDALLG